MFGTVRSGLRCPRSRWPVCPGPFGGRPQHLAPHLRPCPRAACPRGAPKLSGRRLSVASGGIPTESRSPRNRTRPEPCPALWSLAKPGAAAQVRSPTETDGEFTGHARSRAGPECPGGGVSRCGGRRPRRARRSPAGRSAAALFPTLSGGSE
ncbi:unnamed protein product, partial [Gulo gulo]